jgi:hypothetical protein
MVSYLAYSNLASAETIEGRILSVGGALVHPTDSSCRYDDVSVGCLLEMETATGEILSLWGHPSLCQGLSPKNTTGSTFGEVVVASGCSMAIWEDMNTTDVPLMMKTYFFEDPSSSILSINEEEGTVSINGKLSVNGSFSVKTNRP